MDISTGPENLYLSEIDDVPESNKSTTVQSRRPECSVESKGSTKTSDRTVIRLTTNGELFPNPPRKLSPARECKRTKDKFNNSRSRNPSTCDRRSLTKGNRLRSAIVKPKNHSESTRNFQSTSNSLSVGRNKYGNKPNKLQTLFGRIDPEILNPLSSHGEVKQRINVTTATVNSQTFDPETSQRIQRNFVSVGTQTDPCKCSQRNKQKNKNRREAAKLNRDIVKHLVDSEVIHITN